MHAEECHLIKPLWEMLTRIAGKDGDDAGKRSRDDGEEGSSGSSPTSSSEGGKKRAKEGEEDTSSGGSQRPYTGGRPVVNVPVIMSGQPTAVIGRDLIRLLFEYFELDAATMMGVTRLWQQIAQQIDWKRTVLARLDKVRTGVMYSLAEWIYTYDIFALFPNLLPFGGGGEGGDEPITLPQLIGMIDAPQDRLRLMSVLMLYYMFEEDCIAMGREPNGGMAYEARVRETVALLSHGEGLRLDWRYRDRAPDLHFPVGVLTREIPGTAPVGWGMRNRTLVDMSAIWGPDSARNALVRRPGQGRGIHLNPDLHRIKNFPKAVLQARYMFDGVIAIADCPQWSEASFSVLAQLDNLKRILFRNDRWTTCSLQCLQIAGLEDFRVFGGSGLERLTVPASLLTPFPSEQRGGGELLVYRGTRQKIRGLKIGPAVRTIIIQVGPSEIPPNSVYIQEQRSVPPVRVGEELIRHVTQLLIDAADGTSVLILVLRASAKSLGMTTTTRTLTPSPPPRDADMHLVVAELYAWLEMERAAVSTAEFFIGVAEKSANWMPVTSFRQWFENGVHKELPSHARKLCQISAVRRRGPGATISLEEMAEAFGEWRKVDALAAEDRSPWGVELRMRQHIASSKNVQTLVLGIGKNNADISPDMAMDIIDWSHNSVHAAKGLTLRMDNVASLPAWLWLCAPNIVRLEVNSMGRPFRLPDQMMYHPGLRSFALACSGWRTHDMCPQWTLFDIPAHAVREGGRYVHDFSDLAMDISDVQFPKHEVVFPPLNVQRYKRLFVALRPADGNNNVFERVFPSRK